MTRCRRLLRAKCSTDFAILILVLCISGFLVKRLSHRHDLQTVDLDDDKQLQEISLNDQRNDEDSQYEDRNQQLQPTPSVSSYGRQKHEVDQRILQINDFRSADCRSKFKSWTTDVTVTIVVEYSDYEFYDVKNTVDSCIVVNPATAYIKQIIAVDSSTLDYIIDEARTYFSRLPSATLLRSSDARLSSAQARTAAASASKGDVLVFMDSTVICAPGWLDPLIHALQQNRDSIVSPHMDRLRDPVSLEYERTEDSLVAGMSWDLSVRMRNAPAGMWTDDGCCVRTPTLRGNLMAIRRLLFTELGGYDTRLAAELKDSGHNVELSLRAWMCGASLYTVPCSRVGVLNLRDPVKVRVNVAKVTDMNSVMYIASLWLKPKLSIVLNSAHYTGSTGDASLQSISTRGRSTARCDATSSGRDVDWFLSKVATQLILPSLDAVKFGMLRVSTGRCARLLTTTYRISLQDCLRNVYDKPPKEMTFELSRDGQLRVVGLCLTVQNNAYLLAKECTKSETRQAWKYTQNHELYNVWSHYCATHVTDPDTSAPNDRQIAMAQDCSTGAGGDSSQFRTWQFIAN